MSDKPSASDPMMDLPDDYRFTDLVGIRVNREDRSWGETAMFWSLNAVLVVLCAAVLVVAFTTLNPNDPRLSHNPWTYAVVTPIALAILSALLSTVVSHVVERSMQLAFLLSVLVHLILLASAVNIVIFSRMWPDMLDSLAKQRQELKRESLQAKQYVRLSSSSATRRPDYLRPAETVAPEPTEVEEQVRPTLQLAPSTVKDLVSPTPKRERVASAHMLEREKPQVTKATADMESASLSRSELNTPELERSNPRQLEMLDPSPAPRPLEAADVQANRKRGQQNDSQSPALRSELLSPSLAKNLSQSSATRAERQPTASKNSVESLANEIRQLSRSSRAESINSNNRVSQLESRVPESLQPTAIQPSAADFVRSRSAERNDSSLSLQSPSLMNDSLAAALPRKRPTTAPSERRQQQFAVPDPSAGATAREIERAIAGGVSGPAASSSLKVMGPESLSSNNPTQSLDAQSTVMRRRRGQSMPSSGMVGGLQSPASPNWSGRTAVSGGVQGRSPSELAAANMGGQAASQDVAGLTGTSGDIARADVGMSGPRGPLAMSSSVDVPASGEASAGDSRASESIAASGTELGRSRGRQSGSSQSAQVPGLLDAPSQASERSGGTGSLARRATDGVQPGDAAFGEDVVGKGDAIARSATLASNAPAGGQVDLSELAAGDPMSSSENPSDSEASLQLASDLQGAGQLRRRSASNDSASIGGPLDFEIDAEQGPGGLNPMQNVAGAMLSRRRDMSPVLSQPQIDSQRFERSEVGGRLAAGSDVVKPAPAFQQRLDRLRDPSSGQDLDLGPQTELAIERGLEFLAKNQREDGSWRLQDFDTAVLMRSDTAATGLALLAFQGAGYTHKQFKYAQVVDKALKFLARNQQTNGDLYIRQDPASDQNAWLYSHSIASLAVCEAYGMTQDEELKPLAQGAIDFMVASQDVQRGGWRYRPGAGSDTSVTGWFMMAFKSGQLAGLKVPPEIFDRIKNLMDKTQASPQEPHLYRYNPYALDTPQQRHGLKPTPVMTSVGLLIRLYTGWKRDLPAMQDGADHLLLYPPAHGSSDASLRDTYYWYYATQVMFHMGGDRWKSWHGKLYPLLIDNQIVDGANAGSWDPTRPTPDLWGRYGGRLYVTTMNLLSLEVSYRHLPLYEATAQ